MTPRNRVRVPWALLSPEIVSTAGQATSGPVRPAADSPARPIGPARERLPLRACEVRGVLAALVAAAVDRRRRAVRGGAGEAAAPARDPVIIVAGTFAGQPVANVFYAPLAARLRADGYRPYIFGLPTSGTQDIAGRPRRSTPSPTRSGPRPAPPGSTSSATRQGGLVSRHYVQLPRRGSTEVDAVISLGAPHYGTAVANVAKLFGLGNCIGHRVLPADVDRLVLPGQPERRRRHDRQRPLHEHRVGQRRGRHPAHAPAGWPTTATTSTSGCSRRASCASSATSASPPTAPSTAASRTRWPTGP